MLIGAFRAAELEFEGLELEFAAKNDGLAEFGTWDMSGGWGQVYASAARSSVWVPTRRRGLWYG